MIAIPPEWLESAMTVAAYLLLSNGSGPVYPVALASTTNADE
jgi:hypothetical protein